MGAEVLESIDSASGCQELQPISQPLSNMGSVDHIGGEATASLVCMVLEHASAFPSH
jgi:hypothetical protein